MDVRNQYRPTISTGLKYLFGILIFLFADWVQLTSCASPARRLKISLSPVELAISSRCLSVDFVMNGTWSFIGFCSISFPEVSRRRDRQPPTDGRSPGRRLNSKALQTSTQLTRKSFFVLLSLNLFVVQIKQSYVNQSYINLLGSGCSVHVLDCLS